MDYLGSILEIVAELGEAGRDDGKPEEQGGLCPTHHSSFSE